LSKEGGVMRAVSMGGEKGGKPRGVLHKPKSTRRGGLVKRVRSWGNISEKRGQKN